MTATTSTIKVTPNFAACIPFKSKLEGVNATSLAALKVFVPGAFLFSDQILERMGYSSLGSFTRVKFCDTYHFYFYFFILRKKVDRPTSKRRRQLTT
jgi:hypothetical protein